MQLPYEAILSTLKIFSGLPLIVYPFMIIANIMSIAAHHNKGEEIKLSFKEKTFRMFLYYSTAYPIMYFISYRLCNYFIEQNNYNTAMAIIILPLLLLIALFKLSMK